MRQVTVSFIEQIIQMKMVRYIVFVIIIFTACSDIENDSEEYPYNGCEQFPVTVSEKEEWMDILPSLEGVPYKLGGQSPNEGFDCSGLVVWLYNQIGIYDFRYKENRVTDVSADSIYHYNTEPLYDLIDMEKGDLIFFDSDFDGIQEHVSIYVQIDEEGEIWVWDAAEKPDGQEINSVTYRNVVDFYNKNPSFANPLKTICNLTLHEMKKE